MQHEVDGDRPRPPVVGGDRVAPLVLDIGALGIGDPQAQPRGREEGDGIQELGSGEDDADARGGEGASLHDHQRVLPRTEDLQDGALEPSFRHTPSLTIITGVRT